MKAFRLEKQKPFLIFFNFGILEFFMITLSPIHCSLFPNHPDEFLPLSLGVLFQDVSELR